MIDIESLYYVLPYWKYYFLGIFLVYFVASLFLDSKRSKMPNGAKEVPRVWEGWLPYAGNGLRMSKDFIGFMQRCLKNYGKIFKIKVFLRDVVVIMDHDLKKEFFKASEDVLSLYEQLNSLYFNDAFCDDPRKLNVIIRVLKKSVGVKFEAFMPKMIQEARTMTERMKQSHNSHCDLVSEMMRFVSRTSARCFVAIDMSPEFFDNLMKFTHLFNKLIVLTYFMPKWLIHRVYRQTLRKYRNNMKRDLIDEIAKYRVDMKKNDSILLRRAVDYVDEETGETLTDDMIGDIVVCLLYVGTENTALALSNTMIDLSCNEKYWNSVKDQCKQYVDDEDFRGLMADPLVQACVMESVRMNGQLFPLSRKPMQNHLVIGDKKYYVGDADTVCLCEPLMHQFDCAKDFQDAGNYNPDRFLEPMNEKDSSEFLMTWGHGFHLCPGKQFAVMEIKTAIAFIVNNFERFDVKLGGVNYFSPAALAEREATVTLRVLNHANGTAIASE